MEYNNETVRFKLNVYWGCRCKGVFDFSCFFRNEKTKACHNQSHAVFFHFTFLYSQKANVPKTKGKLVYLILKCIEIVITFFYNFFLKLICVLMYFKIGENIFPVIKLNETIYDLYLYDKIQDNGLFNMFQNN